MNNALELELNNTVHLGIRKKVYKLIKRMFDILASFLAIIFFSPIFLLIAILIKIDSKGSVIYKHKRIGKDGKYIYLYKFRSMYVDADKRLKKLLKKPKIKKEWKKNFKLENDPRITKVGKILRKTSLDELPELFNICKGDMSIVGPRPLLVEYLPWYTNTERKRHAIRPGLTGWAQVNGRNSLDWDNRLKADVYYVENLSFGLDVRIFFLTIKKVLMHENVAVNTRDIEPNFAEQRRSKSNIGESEKI